MACKFYWDIDDKNTGVKFILVLFCVDFWESFNSHKIWPKCSLHEISLLHIHIVRPPKYIYIQCSPKGQCVKNTALVPKFQSLRSQIKIWVWSLCDNCVSFSIYNWSGCPDLATELCIFSFSEVFISRRNHISFLNDPFRSHKISLMLSQITNNMS